MAKKKAGTSKSKQEKKDVAAFVHYIHNDKRARTKVKKGWDEVIKDAKKRGFKFTKQELHNHLKKKYNVKKLPGKDEPDTCICL